MNDFVYVQIITELLMSVKSKLNFNPFTNEFHSVLMMNNLIDDLNDLVSTIILQTNGYEDNTEYKRISNLIFDTYVDIFDEAIENEDYEYAYILEKTMDLFSEQLRDYLTKRFTDEQC